MDAFLGWRRDAGYRRVLTVRTLDPLLGYLRQAGLAPQAAAESLPPAQVVLRRYRAYLTGVRGVSAGCARNRQNVIGPFLAGRAARNGGRLLPGATDGGRGARVLALQRQAAAGAAGRSAW